MKANSRESNFELLRIFAIFMVIVHHSLLEGAHTVGYTTDYSLSDGQFGVFLNCCCLVGVNLFVMITGWFGCKTPFKNIGKILIEVILIYVIVYGIGVFLKFEVVNLSSLRQNFDLFNNWFVIAYLELLLIIPLIEFALENNHIFILKLFSKKKNVQSITIILFVLLLINVYFGWWKSVVNENGYNFLNFMLIYVLARWLRLKKNFIVNKRMLLIFGYVFCSILLCILFIYNFGIKNEPETIQRTMHVMGYNNPLIILSSSCLFCVFASYKFYSKFVNNISIAVFGVYLIPCMPWLANLWYSYANKVFLLHSYIGLIAFDIVFFATLVIISYMINVNIISQLIKFYNKNIDKILIFTKLK